MSYIALYQGTASEAAEKVRNADSSWAEAHSEWQEERTCTAHLKVRPFKTHGKCLFSAASEAVPFQKRFMKPALVRQVVKSADDRLPYLASSANTLECRRCRGAGDLL